MNAPFRIALYAGTHIYSLEIFHCGSLMSTGEGGWLFIIRFSKSILFFVNWISLYFFPFLIQYYHITFIIIVFWLACDRPSGLLYFVPALILSMLTPLFLSSSFVSLSYFVLSVPMRKCLGKHSCMSSPFPKLYWMVLAFFPTVQLQVHNVYSERKTRNSCAQVNLCL